MDGGCPASVESSDSRKKASRSRARSSLEVVVRTKESYGGVIARLLDGEIVVARRWSR